MAESSVIRIEELTGKKRSVELHGSGLPHRPAEWSGKQNVKTTWYPGNTRGSQQVLGPQETASHWTGKWSLTKLLRSPCILSDNTHPNAKATNPSDIKDFCEDIFRSGSLLRVSWLSEDPNNDYQSKIVREGRCSDWKWQYDTALDLAWDITFDWVGRNQAQAVTATRADNSSNTDQVMAAINAYLAHVNGSPFSSFLNSFSIGQIKALLNAPLQAIQTFTRAVQNIASTFSDIASIGAQIGNMPFAMANTFVDTARNLVAMTNNSIDQLSRTPPDLLAMKRGVSDLTQAATFIGKTIDSQRAIAQTARDLEEKVRNQLSRNPGGPKSSVADTSGNKTTMGVYVTRLGDTAIGISLKFYGNPDQAIAILKANHLPWSLVVLPPGKTLIIPNAPIQNG